MSSELGSGLKKIKGRSRGPFKTERNGWGARKHLTMACARSGFARNHMEIFLVARIFTADKLASAAAEGFDVLRKSDRGKFLLNFG